MKWTLNQAAKETGEAKATIMRAIHSGRMSAPKNELGQYEIDPSEFYRVFPPRSTETEDVPGTRTETNPHETGNETSWLDAELKRISELLKVANLERERERDRADSEIRFLRAQIENGGKEREAMAEERRTLTVQLLAYQRPPEPPATPPATPAPETGAASPAPGKRGLFALFRKAG